MLYQSDRSHAQADGIVLPELMANLEFTGRSKSIAQLIELHISANAGISEKLNIFITRLYQAQNFTGLVIKHNQAAIPIPLFSTLKQLRSRAYPNRTAAADGLIAGKGKRQLQISGGIINQQTFIALRSCSNRADKYHRRRCQNEQKFDSG